MSNTLIDLEGLEAFYTKVLAEDLSEYAMYDSSIPSEIVAPTLNGSTSRHKLLITNNDSRPLTFYYGRVESIDKDDPDSFEGSIRIDAGVNNYTYTDIFGYYYVKAYADDGAESPVYTVLVSSGAGGTDD